jgi:hypothetical protein
MTDSSRRFLLFPATMANYGCIHFFHLTSGNELSTSETDGHRQSARSILYDVDVTASHPASPKTRKPCIQMTGFGAELQDRVQKPAAFTIRQPVE